MWDNIITVLIICAGWETGGYISERIEEWWDSRRNPKFRGMCLHCEVAGTRFEIKTTSREALTKIMLEHYNAFHKDEDNAGLPLTR